MRARLLRATRKGGVLPAAMVFMIIVMVAGTVLLSVSTIHRLDIVRNGVDVRLMISAEAAAETQRGKFTLLAGVQDDWSWVSTTGWTDLGTVSVNGQPVQTQAKLVSGNSVPRARIRARASASGRTRVVEQTIRVASFSDYALYSGSAADAPIGANFKMYGPFYSRGNINLLGNPGIEFFGETTTSGTVTGNNPANWAYNFKQGVDMYAPPISIPPAAYGSAPVRTRAQALGTSYAGSSNFPQWNVPSAGFLFYRNTVRLTFNQFSSGGVNGTQVTRSYYRRNSGSGGSYSAGEYSLQTEVTTLPQNEEIVLYVDTDQAPLGYDTWSGTVRNYYPDPGYVELSGTIRNARITVYSEKDVRIINNVSYYSNLQNPSYRQPANKQGAGALGFTEMLGICAEDEVDFYFGSFTPLHSGDTGWVTGGKANQYILDAVFMGTTSASLASTPPTSYDTSEMWLCGGIINTNYHTTGFGAYFNPRHYDWDYRLQTTTPPYFLRAYNTTAVFVPGSWRTWEE